MQKTKYNQKRHELTLNYRSKHDLKRTKNTFLTIHCLFCNQKIGSENISSKFGSTTLYICQSCYKSEKMFLERYNYFDAVNIHNILIIENINEDSFEILMQYAIALTELKQCNSINRIAWHKKMMEFESNGIEILYCDSDSLTIEKGI